MKSGLTLEQLVAELTRQNNAKENYMVSTHSIKMESCGAELFLRMVDGEENDRIEPFEIGEVAHRQMGAYLGIHAKYYNKMLEQAPGLLIVAFAVLQHQFRRYAIQQVEDTEL